MRVKLSDITQYSKGVQINGDELVDNGDYIYLNGGINPSGRWTESNVGANTVTISEGGNSSGYINYITEPFWCGAHCYYLFNGPKNTKYLYYALKSQQDRLFAIRSGACMPNIKKSDLGKFDFEFDTNEQKQNEIVATLSRVENVIACRKRELELLDDLIKARFVEMFGSIHDGKFEMKTLPEIVSSDKNSIKRGPFGGALKKDDFVEEGYLVYEQRHAIHNDFEYAKYYITQEKYEDMIGFKVVPGDLIISCSGVTLGRIAEVPNGAKEGIINQALLKLSLNQELMMNAFFIQQFRGEEIQEILFGFSRGSGIPNMPSMSEVKAVKFVCPPLELQKQYCDYVHQVDKSKVAVQKSLDETQQLFDSLMQKYFG